MEGCIETTPPLESAELYRGAGGKVKKQLGRNSRAAATPYSRPKPSRTHVDSGVEEGGGGRWWVARLVNPAVRLISGGATKILPSLFARPTEYFEDGPDDVPVEIEQDIEAVTDGDAFHVRALPDAENDSPLRKAKISPGQKDDKLKGIENHRGNEDELLQIEQMIKENIFSRDEISRLTAILQARTAHLPATEEVKPVTSVDAEDHLVAPKVTTEANEKCQMRSKALWAVSTPLLESNVQDEIGASPIDIAKAYMGHRPSGVGSRSDAEKFDSALVPGDAYFSRTLNRPSTLQKPAVYWPVTTLTDQYMTQNQRSGYGIQSSSRSPYARSLRSIPKSKVSSRSLLGNVYESVGSIRLSKQEKIGVGRAGTPVFKNIEAGEISGTSKLQSLDGKSLVSELGVPTVPSHSSRVARKILEHLDRTFPTPKDKAAELKLACSWRKPESPISTQEVAMASENGSSVFEVPPQKTTANDVIQEQTSASKEVTRTTVPRHAARLSSLMRTGGARNSSQTRGNEGTSITASSTVDTLVKDVTNKPAPPSNKAALPSISVQKSRFAVSSDNGTGFTFPVSTSQVAFPEPPTPSIMPGFSGNSLPLPPGDASLVPSYTFGKKRSSPPLVFSFPSTSSSPIKVDSLDLKFTFGSPDNKRILFSSVGKDEVCC